MYEFWLCFLDESSTPSNATIKLLYECWEWSNCLNMMHIKMNIDAIICDSICDYNHLKELGCQWTIHAFGKKKILLGY